MRSDFSLNSPRTESMRWQCFVSSYVFYCKKEPIDLELNLAFLANYQHILLQNSSSAFLKHPPTPLSLPSAACCDAVGDGNLRAVLPT